MILQNKLKFLELNRSYIATSSFLKITHISDQLVEIGEKVANENFVNMALNGFPSWSKPFVKGIWILENLPNFKKLWDDCIHGQTQIQWKRKKKGDDDNLTLIS